MRVEPRTCLRQKECPSYEPKVAPVAPSINVTKTNTLHQFDTANIIGVQSPVGKLPIVFYLKESCTRGRRGIVFCGDRDAVNFLYPETEHADWCTQPYDMKYDAVEHFDNGIESGFKRNHGIFQLWVNVWRKWYNGQVMYRPHLKIQGCGRDDNGYPVQETTQVSTQETTQVSAQVSTQVTTQVKKTKLAPCGCGGK